MKQYKALKEPYRSKIYLLLPLKTLENGDSILTFDTELVYNVSKATGLKSKKKRHIEKRFKIVINQAIINLMEKYNENHPISNINDIGPSSGV